MIAELSHSLDRDVLIRATPDTVFRFFTDSARWAAWWGAGSTIDARVGGDVKIKLPGNTEAGGTVMEIDPPARIVFTYGYAGNANLPVGASRVTIELAPDAAGTRLRLRHDLPSSASRDEHVQGWRYQLSLFANVVADEVNARAAAIADAWFDAWFESDVEKRAGLLATIASDDVRVQDRFSNLDSRDDLVVHITAAQRFMPGFRMRRAGDTRHCQGMVLADWSAAGPDGAEKMRGTNVFVLGPTGRIECVTGFVSS